MEQLTLLGHITWLWMNSPLHKHWPVHLLTVNVMPALQHQQFFLLMQDNLPVAYCSWAKLSLDKEVKYILDTNSLTLEDWISGDRYWFIDWIAPFGHTKDLYKQMRSRFPNQLFRAIHVTENSTEGKVTEFHGSQVDKQAAERQFQHYHQTLMDELGKYDRIQLFRG